MAAHGAAFFAAGVAAFLLGERVALALWPVTLAFWSGLPAGSLILTPVDSRLLVWTGLGLAAVPGLAAALLRWRAADAALG